MENKNSIETIGYIAKEEYLKTFDQSIIPNTFILENKNPYPGYHGQDLPGAGATPEYIYLITKRRYHNEEVYRATKNIKKYISFDFDAALCDLSIHNDEYASVRIKDLQKMDQIIELQSAYKEEGFQFKKSKKVETKGIIKVFKHFWTEEVEEGVFMDLEDKNMGYLEMPTYMNWKMFEKITKTIKNNIENNNFDAAVGGMYRRNGLTEIVRIYDEKRNLDALKKLKSMYCDEIKKNFV